MRHLLRHERSRCALSCALRAYGMTQTSGRCAERLSSRITPARARARAAQRASPPHARAGIKLRAAIGRHESVSIAESVARIETKIIALGRKRRQRGGRRFALRGTNFRTVSRRE